MRVLAGKAYRARTAAGDVITFTVIEEGPEWPLVDLDTPDGPEPGVWLNTRQLLWISTETHRGDAVLKATAEVIESLERSERS
jgi:hypothetical protein